MQADGGNRSATVGSDELPTSEEVDQESEEVCQDDDPVGSESGNNPFSSQLSKEEGKNLNVLERKLLDLKDHYEKGLEGEEFERNQDEKFINMMREYDMRDVQAKTKTKGFKKRKQLGEGKAGQTMETYISVLQYEGFPWLHKR